MVTDNGPQFISHEFESFLKTRNIKHRFSTIYHPEGNSEVERFNKIINETIQSARLDKKSVMAASEFLGIYRSTRHLTTGSLRLSYCMHGRPMRTRLDIIGATLAPRVKTDTEVSDRDSAKQAKCKVNTDARKGAKFRCFEEGEMVRVKIPWHVKKGESKLSEPRRILTRVNPSVYILENGQKWNVKFLAPFSVPGYVGEKNNEAVPFFELNDNPQIQNAVNAGEQRPVRARDIPVRLQGPVPETALSQRYLLAWRYLQFSATLKLAWR
jgi:hypothetical protein